MKKNILFLLVVITFFSCSRMTKDKLQNELKNRSFYLINQNNDSIPLEFINDHYVRSFEFTLLDNQWDVTEKNNSIYLYLEGTSFEFIKKENESYFFSDNKVTFSLIKIERNLFNFDYLLGDWIEVNYSKTIEDTTLKRPPCPNNIKNGYQLPILTFTKDKCIDRDFCYTYKRKYKTNSSFGCINFGEYCSDIDQWTVLKLTQDTLIVNKMSRKMSEIVYEDNIQYIKYNLKK